MTRMTNYFSSQQVIQLLVQLKDIYTEYPPEMLATRRKIFLGLVMQLAITNASVEARKGQFAASIVREPMSTIVKVLMLVFIAYLIAFVLHSIAIGSVNFEWFLELLSH
jgi:hypothetical protein